MTFVPGSARCSSALCLFEMNFNVGFSDFFQRENIFLIDDVTHTLLVTCTAGLVTVIITVFYSITDTVDVYTLTVTALPLVAGA